MGRGTLVLLAVLTRGGLPSCNRGAGGLSLPPRGIHSLSLGVGPTAAEGPGRPAPLQSCGCRPGSGCTPNATNVHCSF